MAGAGKPRFYLQPDEFAKAMELVAPDVTAHGKAVAATLSNSLPEGVEVTTRQSVARDGRPVCLVTIAHPSGLARQAKHGVLTRAAAENGLEVTRYSGR